jgi:cell division protein FtsB
MRPRRIVLLGLALLLAALLVQPLQSYLAAQRHYQRAAASLRSEQAEHDALQRALQDASSKAALVRAARELGYVFPGETPYSLVQP